MADILLIIDSTGSTGAYIDALRQALPEIIGLCNVSGLVKRIGIISYKDYSDKEVLSWSGWNHGLTDFADELQASGGGDFPEAAKTALSRALDLVDPSNKTLVLWYTDAPPHHPSQRSVNRYAEEKALPSGRTDWVRLCYEAAEKHLYVFPIIPKSLEKKDSSFYVFLATVTGGICLTTTDEDSMSISRLSLDLIISCIGYPPPAYSSSAQPYSANILRYLDSPLSAKEQPTNELYGSQNYLPSEAPYDDDTGKFVKAMSSQALNLNTQPLPPLPFNRIDLPERFRKRSEIDYRATVYKSLSEVISHNPFCMEYNPVFSQLWRVVVKQPPNDARDTLLQLMMYQISKIADSTQGHRMSSWLEKSYDSSTEIEEIIATFSSGGPCIYLDLVAGVDLTRMELLEISRDTFPSVLQRLTSILTHLQIVDRPNLLSIGHRKLPLSLPPDKIFRLLPHLVVPGTLYSHRAASLLAALTLVIDVPFLKAPAIAVVEKTRGKWLSLDTPEYISFETANFLLNTPPGIVLNQDERRTYEGMRRMGLIEINLDRKLVARVPWTPNKTRQVGDRKVACQKCGIKRSTTIMSDQQPGICGLCIESASRPGLSPEQFRDKGEMTSCWVECSVATCRAQYVVENVDGLRVAPKCWYCRKRRQGSPILECSKCYNQVIVPLTHRSETDTPKTYVCPACSEKTSLHSAIIDKTTTTRILLRQNRYDTTWLGFTNEPSLFQGRSALKLFRSRGAAIFAHDRAETLDPSVILTLDFKRVHNISGLVDQLENLMGIGAKIMRGTCHLCFKEFIEMSSACGRPGCDHKADDGCLRGWYGKNQPGNLFDFMQLVCAFCREAPSTHITTRFIPRLPGLGGLSGEIPDQSWLYGWCSSCGSVKPAFERSAVVVGQLPVVQNFQCQECRI